MAVINIRNWAVFLGRVILKILTSQGSVRTIARLDRQINLHSLSARKQSFATDGKGLVFACRDNHADDRFGAEIGVLAADGMQAGGNIEKICSLKIVKSEFLENLQCLLTGIARRSQRNHNAW